MAGKAFWRALIGGAIGVATFAVLNVGPAPAAADLTETETVAVADTRVAERRPNSAYGELKRLIVGSTPGYESYFRFDLSETDGDVARATLHVYKADRVVAS